MTDLAQAQARILELEAEVERLETRVSTLESPFRRHAQSHDLGAPLRFSVQDSRNLIKQVTS